MSWLFSQALVEAFSAATCSAGRPSAPSNGNPTPRAYLPSDKTTAFSRPSRSGMTFGPLTDDLGAELLTWFLAASRARTSASQGKVPASLASVPACGPTWRASLAKFDPVSCSWKTAQLSLLGDSELSSVTWPRSGMTADGQCWELPMLERPTSATASGLWPTPCASDNSDRKPPANVHISATGIPKHIAPNGEKSQMRLSQAVQMWPTPTSSLGTKGGRVTQAKGREGGTLIEALSARMFPTPAARDYRSPNAKPYSERGGGKKGEQLPNFVGGALNPTWVEWLMGWPLGWTDLEPSATAKYPPVLPRLGESSPEKQHEVEQH